MGFIGLPTAASKCRKKNAKRGNAAIARTETKASNLLQSLSSDRIWI